MPKLTKRGKIWYYSFSVDGNRCRRSSRTSDKKLAEEIAIKHEAKVRYAAVHGPEALLTFAEALKIYVDDGGPTRFTVPLLDYFGKWNVRRIVGPKIRSAAKAIYPNALPTTWNRQVIVPVRAIINHAADALGIPKLSVQRFKEEKRKRPAGDKKWIEAFCAAAIELDMPEVAAAARFMFETAARISDACGLEWDDVNLKDRRAYLRKTKTDPRTVILTRAMVIAMSNISTRHPTRVFGMARQKLAKRIDEVIKHAGLRRLTSHEFGRHGFATEMIVKSGVDVVTTAELGGGKSVQLLLQTYVEGNAHPELSEKVFGKNDSARRKTDTRAR